MGRVTLMGESEQTASPKPTNDQLKDTDSSAVAARGEGAGGGTKSVKGHTHCETGDQGAGHTVEYAGVIKYYPQNVCDAINQCYTNKCNNTF